jgi:hypothetical protein
MLLLVKLNKMDSLTEKRINSHIQTWIRAPGCLAHTFLSWTSWRYDPSWCYTHAYLPEWLVFPAVLVVMVTFYWNGLFFQSRVVGNYAEKELERALINAKRLTPKPKGDNDE